MVAAVGFKSLHDLIEATVPAAIKRPPMQLGKYQEGYTESDFLEKFKCAFVHSTPGLRGLGHLLASSCRGASDRASRGLQAYLQGAHRANGLAQKH